MSVIDKILGDNAAPTRDHPQSLSYRPARRLAVLSCMDCRMDVERILDLQPGDAHVLRNAGGEVTEDVLRSLLISHYKMGVEEIMIINHTQCGMMTFQDDDLRRELQSLTGTTAVAPAYFATFRSLEDHVREQIQKLTTHPWFPKKIPVRGFIYDVQTGRLSEVP